MSLLLGTLPNQVPTNADLGTMAFQDEAFISVGAINIAGAQILSGSGSPSGVVTASPGTLYLNTAGGTSTTLYVKETGTLTNTGWVGK
jgi:hypothetical protein